MVDPSKFFENSKVPCQRCGKANNFGSSEALFHADASRRCVHCGFSFIAHKLRQMAKVVEMATVNPEWLKRFNNEDWAWIQAQLDNLVPIDEDD